MSKSDESENKFRKLQQFADMLAAQNRQLEQDLADSLEREQTLRVRHTSFEQAPKDYEDIREKVTALNDKLARKNAELCAKNLEITTLTSSIEELSQELDRLRQDNSGAEERRARVEQLWEKDRDQIAQLSRQLQDLANFSQKLTEENSTLKNFKQSWTNRCLADMKSLRIAFAQFEGSSSSSLDKLGQKLLETRKKLAGFLRSSTKKFQDTHDQEQELNAMNRKVALLENQVTSYKALIATQREPRVQSPVKNTPEKIKSVPRQMKSTGTSATEKKQLKEIGVSTIGEPIAEKDRTISMLNTELCQLKKELESSKHQLNYQTRSSTELETLLCDYKNKIEHLKNERNGIIEMAQSMSAVGVAEKAEKLMEKMVREQSELIGQNTELTLALDASNVRSEAQKAQVVQLEETLSAKESELEELRAKLAHSTSELKKLKKATSLADHDVQRAKAKSSGLEETIKKQAQLLATLSGIFTSKLKEAGVLRESEDNRIDEEAKLRSEITSLKSKLIKSKEKIEHLEAQFSNKRSQILKEIKTLLSEITPLLASQNYVNKKYLKAFTGLFELLDEKEEQFLHPETPSSVTDGCEPDACSICPSLKKVVEQLKNSLVEVEALNLAKRKDLEAQLEVANSTIERSKGVLNYISKQTESESKAMVTRAKQQREKIEAESDRARLRSVELRAARDKIDQLTQRLLAAEELKKADLEGHKAKKVAIEELQEALVLKEAELSKAREKLKLASLREKNEESSRAENVQLRQKIDEITIKQAADIEKLSSLKRELILKGEVINDLRAKIASQKKPPEPQPAESSVQKDKMNKLEIDLARKNEIIGGLKVKLEKLEENVQAKIEEISQEKSLRAKLSENERDARRQLEKLRSTIESLKSALIRLGEFAALYANRKEETMAQSVFSNIKYQESCDILELSREDLNFFLGEGAGPAPTSPPQDLEDLQDLMSFCTKIEGLIRTAADRQS